MKGTITKIHPLKRSRNGNSFIRIELRLAGGDWAKTDICPDFINYSRWKDLLKEGLDLDGLELKRPGEVNADSYPRIFKEKVEGRWIRNPDDRMTFVKDTPVEVKPLPEEKPIIQPKLF